MTAYFLEKRCIYASQRKAKRAILIKRLQEHSEVPWELGNECYDCCEKFTMIFRRHHCRLCGRSICDNCTKILENRKTCKKCCLLLKNEDNLIEDPMKPLFEKIEALKIQMLEILPYFNGLLMQIDSSNEKERKELHNQATELRSQLTIVLEGIQKNITLLKQIPAKNDYKKCIDNYIKSIHLFMQSFTSTMRTFK